MQGLPFGVQETACAAAGNNNEATTGKANSAEFPSLLTSSLRETETCSRSAGNAFSKSFALRNLPRVSQMISSSKLDPDSSANSRTISETVFCPSQSIHTCAAVRFKQWALFVSTSRSINSVSNFRATRALRGDGISGFFLGRASGGVVCGLEPHGIPGA